MTTYSVGQRVDYDGYPCAITEIRNGEVADLRLLGHEHNDFTDIPLARLRPEPGPVR